MCVALIAFVRRLSSSLYYETISPLLWNNEHFTSTSSSSHSTAGVVESVMITTEEDEVDIADHEEIEASYHTKSDSSDQQKDNSVRFNKQLGEPPNDSIEWSTYDEVKRELLPETIVSIQNRQTNETMTVRIPYFAFGNGTLGVEPLGERERIELDITDGQYLFCILSPGEEPHYAMK